LPKLIKLITLFYKGEYNELNKIIPKTTNHEKKLIKTFVAEDFVYPKKKIDLFNMVCWTIFPLFFLLPFLLLKLSGPTIICLILGLLSSISIVLIIRIHNNYQKVTNINAIKISTGINEITVWEGAKEYKFKNTDLKELVIIDPNIATERATPPDSYGYTKTNLTSGKKIIITCMLIDTKEMEYNVWNIPHQVVKKGYAYIK
jgi:hypothetical protein